MNASTVATAAGIQIRYPGRWAPAAAAMFVLAYTAIALLIAGAGNLRSSTWESAGWTLQWLAFGAGIAAGTCLPVLVAHGLTRRTAAAAGIAAVLALAVAMAIFVQLGYALEWLGHRAAGLPYKLDEPHLFSDVGQVHLILTEYTLMFAGFLASGWLVTAGYHRFGGWRGTLALPLAMLPALGGAAALTWPGGLDQPVAVGLSLAVVAAGLAAMALLTRALPLKTT